MPNTIVTDYFYGDKSQQFAYFRVPRLLITNPHFRHLFVEAKLLYGLMLDRMGLSLRNGWLDGDSRVFIFYTLREVQETLGCGHNKATRLLNELEQYGLIERVKQGQGKPAKIYVKNFAEEKSAEQAKAETAELSPSRKNGQKKVIKSREEKCRNQAAEEIKFSSKQTGEIQPSAEWGRTVL